jgi:hypothetical protein
MGALATDGKRAAMAKSTVGLDFDQALDVERDILAKVAFDLALGLDDVTDPVQLVLVERCDLHEGINIRLRKDLRGAGVADSEDVSESDARLFVVRDIDSSNTCHGVPLRLGPAAWPRERVMGLRQVRRVQRKPDIG